MSDSGDALERHAFAGLGLPCMPKHDVQVASALWQYSLGIRRLRLQGEVALRHDQMSLEAFHECIDHILAAGQARAEKRFDDARESLTEAWWSMFAIDLP